MVSRRLLTLVCLSLPVASSAAHAADNARCDVAAWCKSQIDDLTKLYRHFHAHPELSLCEKETAARVAAELKAVGAEVTTGVGGHGVVAIIKNGAGPTVMVRADMDALPVTENTGLPFASQVRVRDASGTEVGVMHACGHDLHMTCLIGVARYLGAHKQQWRGTALLIGQPAEERGPGAQAMLEDGLFQRFPRPDYALALHTDAALAADRVGLRPGYCFGNTDAVDITVLGKGGHGAYPHTTMDPVVQAAQLILALQTIVSREVKPTEPAVVTVGSIHGGTKHNIIPDRVHLQLTVRSYSDEVRRQLLSAIPRKAKAVALACDAPEPIVEIKSGLPALYNDERLTARIEGVFRRVLGEQRVTTAEMSMGGEDFSLYGKAGVPILMFRLGTVNAQRLARHQESGQEPPSLHCPAYYPDAEESLQTGILAMTCAALELLALR
jgi:hippurate hydrolase